MLFVFGYEVNGMKEKSEIEGAGGCGGCGREGSWYEDGKKVARRCKRAGISSPRIELGTIR